MSVHLLQQWITDIIQIYMYRLCLQVIPKYPLKSNEYLEEKKKKKKKNRSNVKAQSRGRYWLLHRRTDVLKQESNISVLCFRVADGVSGVLISPSTVVTGIVEYARGSCLC